MSGESKTIASLKGQLSNPESSSGHFKELQQAEAKIDQGDALWDSGQQGCEVE